MHYEIPNVIFVAFKWTLQDLLNFCIISGVFSEIQKSANADDTGPRVETDSGPIIGKYINFNDRNVASFQSIPYAMPPLQERRFAKPKPIDRWKDALFAIKKPPACMQFSTRNYSFIPLDLNKSEDCLYLNIWVHETHSVQLPVMVWIYGGGFFVGASGMDIYDGSVLATVGRVIVVSINYRLGIFGFLNGGTNDAPGNVGLYDQLLALKWVRKNIEFFGGNSKKITIFGESAGAASVNFHILSPLSRGLFQRAIMESASVYLPIMDDSKRSRFKTNSFALKMGCSNVIPSLVLECLKKKDAITLAHAEGEITSRTLTYFGPYVGGDDFIPDKPIKLIESGKFADVPILLGDVRDEATVILLNYLFPAVFPIDKEPYISLSQAKNLTKKLLPKFFKLPLENILDVVFDSKTRISDNNEIAKILSDILTTFVFVCPSLFFAEKVNHSYYYWMTHRSEKNKHANWTGVEHVSDVLYVFGRPFVDIDDYTDKDRKFSLNIMRKWSRFARTGHPLGKKKSHQWPNVESLSPQAYELNSKNEGIISFPRKEICNILKPLFSLELPSIHLK